MEKIELVVLDIDGVVTDGSITVDSQGKELKKLNLKDVDAIFELHHRGYRIAAITGEDAEIVQYFENRFPWDYFYKGSKTKKDAMKQIEEDTGIGREHICYVMDAMDRNTTHIGNIRAYTLSALYNAPATIEQYYASMVNHDLAEG